MSVTGSDLTIANLNPIRYRGYYYDGETGLYHLMSRYYDPAVGRFLNVDALLSAGQGILGYNMFAYCGNNPVNRMDPTGMYAPALPAFPVVVVPLMLFFYLGSEKGQENLNDAARSVEKGIDGLLEGIKNIWCARECFDFF